MYIFAILTTQQLLVLLTTPYYYTQAKLNNCDLVDSDRVSKFSSYLVILVEVHNQSIQIRLCLGTVSQPILMAPTLFVVGAFYGKNSCQFLFPCDLQLIDVNLLQYFYRTTIIMFYQIRFRPTPSFSLGWELYKFEKSTFSCKRYMRSLILFY